MVVREPVGLEICNPQGSELIKSVELKPRRDEIRTTEVPAGVRWRFENQWGWRFRTTEVPAGVRWWFENQYAGKKIT